MLSCARFENLQSSTLSSSLIDKHFGKLNPIRPSCPRDPFATQLAATRVAHPAQKLAAIRKAGCRGVQRSASSAAFHRAREPPVDRPPQLCNYCAANALGPGRHMTDAPTSPGLPLHASARRETSVPYKRAITPALSRFLQASAESGSRLRHDSAPSRSLSVGVTLHRADYARAIAAQLSVSTRRFELQFLFPG